MSRRRVLVLTGSRADYGLLRTILSALDREERIELLLAVGGSHLVGARATIEEVRSERRIDVEIPMQWEGEVSRTADARALARGVEACTDAFERFRPDLLLILGDRIEVFAGAIAASVGGVRIAHVHGGDVASGVADESMRHAITKLAHLHFPATRASAVRIERMGELETSITMVGSPAVDGLESIEPLEESRWRQIGAPRFAVLLHGTGEADSLERERAESLITMVAKRGPTVLIEPNLDPGRRGIIDAIRHSGLTALDHLERSRFVGLLRRLDVLVGNSSAGLLECAALGVPAVDVGTRQAGRERPNTAIHVERYTGPKLDAALEKAVTMRGQGADDRFGDGSAGVRIARRIATADLAAIPLRKRWSD